MTSPTPPPCSITRPHSGALLFVGAMWVGLYAWLFLPYFNTGQLGGDYSYFLPKLLDEHLYARLNGWLAPQWFTPSFCGGFIGLANPQSTYWSLPHLLTALVSPRWAVFATMLVFAAIGGIGTYLFLRLRYCHWPALICGLLFASNGYHVARMLEGHLGHHGFMLVPLVAWLLAKNHAAITTWTYWRHVAWTALGLAYLVLGGAAPILPQWALTLLLFLAFAHLTGVMRLQRSLATLAMSATLGALLLGPVLLAMLSFMHWNPRTWSPLPQFDTVLNSLLYGTSMILSPMRDTAALWRQVVNPEALLEWHEFEYGLTVFPLLVLTAYFVQRISGPRVSWPKPSDRTFWVGLLLFAGLAMLPFIINGWLGATFVQLVRGLPILGSTSSLFRWYVIPMSAVLLLTAVLLARLLEHRKSSYSAVTALTALLLIGLHYGYLIKPEIDSRRSVYLDHTIEQTYAQKRTDPRHQIVGIAAYTGVQRNDAFTESNSQKLCYEAALGYQLQGMKDVLAPGNIDIVVAGKLNMFNPSCYVYPHENTCAPGTRFDLQRRDAMLDFARYRPLPYSVPKLHQSLVLLSLLAMLVTLLLLIQPLLTWAYRLFRMPESGRLNP